MAPVSSSGRAHVAVLSRAHPRHGPGGIEAIAWDVARGLAGRGVAVSFVTTRIPGSPQVFEEDGVKVEALADTPCRRYSRAWWQGSVAWVEARHRIDPIHAILSVSAGAYAALRLRPSMPGTRFVMQAHGTAWTDCLSKWRTRRPLAIASSARNIAWMFRDLVTYRRFDSVVAVGSPVYEALRSMPIRLLLDPNRVCLVANGVDASVFRPDPRQGAAVRRTLGLGRDVPVVICASRLHPQKGVDLALLGFEALSKDVPDAHLVIVGDGPDRPRLEQLASRPGLRERVLFVGAEPRERVAAYLQAADVFLFTTRRLEGLPLNVLEAVSTGLPSVVSDHLARGLADVPGVLGVDPGNARAIAEGLRAALSGASGPVALPRQYTLAACVERYLDLLLGTSA